MNLEERVVAWLAQQDEAVYLVGGCVRDLLLGRPIYDLDVTTDGNGLALARRLADHFRGAYYPLDEVRSTGRALLMDRGKQRLMVDIARLRGPDLAADLADRDFTINALAADVRAPDQVIDRHGGQADLEAGLIRPVSELSIRNDPLRALRAVRQAAQFGFALAPETERLIRRDSAALAGVAGERIRDEMARLLARSDAAAHLRLMDDLGLLTIVWPELEPIRGLAQSPPHHLDVLAHSLKAVHELESLWRELKATGSKQPAAGNRQPAATGIPDSRIPAALLPFAGRIGAHLAEIMSDARPRLVTLKLAVLLHDTGKAATQSVDEGGRIRFLQHEVESARQTGQALRRLRFQSGEVRLGEVIVRHHMRPLLLAQQDGVSSRAVYRFFRDTTGAGVDVLLHALADQWATPAPGVEDGSGPRLLALVARMLTDYWEQGPERVDPPRLLRGNDLLREFDLQPGPHIGELLEAVREAQVTGEVSSREEALALVREQLAEASD